jgi:hypothetical protein
MKEDLFKLADDSIFKMMAENSVPFDVENLAYLMTALLRLSIKIADDIGISGEDIKKAIDCLLGKIEPSEIGNNGINNKPRIIN